MWLAKFSQNVQVGPQMGTQERMLLFNDVDTVAQFIKDNEIRAMVLQYVQMDKTPKRKVEISEQ